MVAGIRDYGNRVGIPTVAGSTHFNKVYNGMPLVNAGCIGIETVILTRAAISKFTGKNMNDLKPDEVSQAIQRLRILRPEKYFLRYSLDDL